MNINVIKKKKDYQTKAWSYYRFKSQELAAHLEGKKKKMQKGILLHVHRKHAILKSVYYLKLTATRNRGNPLSPQNPDS